jgi:1-acyl-sn-glycerol-3-phosphate acyltransferase
MYFFHEAVYRHTGRLPMTLAADFVFKIPFLGWLASTCGAAPAGREAALRQLNAGGIVVVAPGGIREAMAPSAADYDPRKTFFGKRGFAELAQSAGVALVPMFTRNIRECFLVLGGENKLVQRLYSLTKLPFTPFFGPLPVPLTTVLGAPLAHQDGATTEAVARRAVDALIDLIRAQGSSAVS